jgi:hypothetical protein
VRVELHCLACTYLRHDAVAGTPGQIVIWQRSCPDLLWSGYNAGPTIRTCGPVWLGCLPLTSGGAIQESIPAFGVFEAVLLVPILSISDTAWPSVAVRLCFSTQIGYQ